MIEKSEWKYFVYYILFFLFFSAVGVINRGDSFRRRRSRSNSLIPTSPLQYHAPEEVLPSRHGPVESHHVYLLGSTGVGKAALLSQFMTSDSINAYEGPGIIFQKQII